VTVIGLKNKKPVWDPVSKGYCLDFRGRITEPSVKNFQLVAVSVSEPNSRVVLQVGVCVHCVVRRGKSARLWF